MDDILTTDLVDLEDQFEDYAIECECAIRTVMARLTNLQTEMERSPERSFLFDSIDYRIKSFDSTIEKLRRRGLPCNIEEIKKLHDIAGIRIITPFRDDIYTVFDAVRRQPSMTVVNVKDYVENPKANGYMSLHLIVNMEIYFMDTSKLIPVEIQIRDKAMDLWATLEHIIRYKNPDADIENDKHIEKNFKRIADMLSSVDDVAINYRDTAKPKKAKAAKS